MLSRKILSTGATARLIPLACHQQQQQSTRAFTVFLTCRKDVDVEAVPTNKSDNPKTSSSKPPIHTARYLLEVAERQKRQELRKAGGRGNNITNDTSSTTPLSEGGEKPLRRFNYRNPRHFQDEASSSKNPANIPVSRFQAAPSIPYDTTKELQFADKIDWEVSSVFESRPVYANVAAGRGAVAPLGTAAVNSNSYNTILPGTALSVHVTGVRANGDLDPEVEQSLIQDLAPIANNNDKDHRKKSDVSSVENQPILFHLTHNYQEILNPRNAVNRFNNGGVKHVANIGYEVSSDEFKGAAGVEDQQAEKSWKRLERLGGDYTRASAPGSLLNYKNVGKEGRTVLDNVGQLIGQNRSIGLEDKKKYLKAVEKGLGSY
ncbi:hypothetical protein BX616_001250 [Lobosporangium transversale]|uniref:Uncharacterized protein n=1 Tax=Lobosporangium transversale TaxID=64571 RepID=A0A1Y2GXG2_9FUNG|nr:hypothetical protein BCR41DRAFT_348407 [Lobosporangium transversale]KAF9904568.1 hypothetical protein BX616_001250 [Lobosporangium transversale]ORZ26504.1 hypothetical protein BCR41DRAFT_348407 [Lobosporangium transversale]|eukprot:XP_021884269.1 hypothetical protein BCR41DRAFT_348407 [Lobosporangium transversale]